MRFIHVSDLHCNKERQKYCLEALSIIKDKILSFEEKPILLITGDIWDSIITNSTVFALYVAAIKELIDITDVYIIYGTPFHEVENSLDIFSALGAKVFRYNTFEDCNSFEIVAIPEPRKVDYMSVNSEQINIEIKKNLANFINSIPKPVKPRIVMYHGEVEGSVYQNGMKIDESPMSFALTKKLLKKLDANTYCFGHIHLPQQVNGLNNAYYAGSVYPKDSGECHNASYNLITIENDNTKVEIIPFGFPINVKEDIMIEDLDGLCKKDYSNKNLILKITLDKLLAKNYSKNDIEKKVLEKTKALSVKLTFNYNRIQSVRNKEISEQTTPKEKFIKYAESQDIKLTDSLLNKIEDIQNSLLIEKFIPNNQFELQYISLRGAIGIKDGQGLDEINIDFTKYLDGILGFTGHSGSGKTTILENCHPFPCLFTRPGTLKDHFCLKDSHRIIIYKDASGNLLKISMFIDGVAKSVGTRYYVETKSDGEEWKTYKSCDGTIASYQSFLDATFGPMEIFLRTSFYAKEQIKGIPDLSRATKSEKMSLFSSLLGLDYLSEVSEAAKIKASDCKTKIKEMIDDCAGFEKMSVLILNYHKEVEKKSAALSEYEAYLKVDLEELKIYEEEQKKFDTAVYLIEEKRKELQSKLLQKEELEREYISLTEENTGLKTQIENKEEYQKDLDWYNENFPKKSILGKERAELMEEYEKVSSKISEYDLAIKNIEKEADSFEKDMFKLSTEIKSLNENKTEINDVCPVCGGKLSSEKTKALLHQQEEINARLKELKKLYSETQQKYKNCIDKKNALSDSTKDRELQKSLIVKINELNSDISLIDEYISSLDLAEIQNVLKYAEPKYNENLKDLEKLHQQIETLTSDCETLEEDLKSLPENYADKIERLKRGIDDSKDNISQLKADIRVLNDNLDSLKEKEDKINNLKTIIKSIDKDVTEYELLQLAFSNNGIQALELSSASPEISDITNTILYETFGERFTVTFDTQRDTKDGRKIDDLIIDVFDGENGREKRLDLLSSGEGILIKQALYYAFSVIRTRKTGFCFKTRFLDESDSSLDSSLRAKYVKMVEAAHKLCNASLTILITHSQEVKDIVSQKIEF